MLNDIIKFTEQKWHQNIYTYLGTISLVVYIIAITGLTVIAPEKIIYLRNFLKIYIAIILIIRFNPFIEPTYNKQNFLFDRKLAFTSGILLLLTTSLTKYIEEIFNINNF